MGGAPGPARSDYHGGVLVVDPPAAQPWTCRRRASSGRPCCRRPWSPAPCCSAASGCWRSTPRRWAGPRPGGGARRRRAGQDRGPEPGTCSASGRPASGRSALASPAARTCATGRPACGCWRARVARFFWCTTDGRCGPAPSSCCPTPTNSAGSSLADPRRLRRQPARRSRSASTVSRKRLRRHRSLRGAGSRELLVHMIEEYARHNGHADLLRERIDGRVGQYAPCDTRIRRPLPGTRGRRIMGSSG